MMAKKTHQIEDAEEKEGKQGGGVKATKYLSARKIETDTKKCLGEEDT